MNRIRQLIDNLRLALPLMRDKRVSLFTKLIPFAALVYILSPIDLIPDFLLPFGLSDDIGALLVGLQMFINSAPKDVVEEYRSGKRKTVKMNTVEGEYRVRDP